MGDDYNQEEQQQRGRAPAAEPPKFDDATWADMHELCNKRWTIQQLQMMLIQQQDSQSTQIKPTDFQRFVYFVSTKQLDPLLGEVHMEYRKGKAAFVTHIEGYRKLADLTGELDGSVPSFEHDKDGKLISATHTIYRKGKAYPFPATCYASEYLDMSKAWTTHAKMPHTMLGKDAEAAAIRRAFPAAVSGILVDSELDSPAADAVASQQGFRSTMEPPSEEDKKRAEVLGGKVQEVGGFSVGVKAEAPAPAQPQPTPASAAAPTPTPAPEPKPDPAPAPQATNVVEMPKPDAVSERTAIAADLTARKAVVLDKLAPIGERIPESEVPAVRKKRDDMLKLYWRGWFGTAPDANLPRNPADYLPALAALEKLAADNFDPQVKMFREQPEECGKRLRSVTESASAPAATPTPAPAQNGDAALTESITKDLKFDAAQSALAARYCAMNELDVNGLKEHLTRVGLDWHHAPKCQHYLLLALHSPLAYQIVQRHKDAKIPLAQLVDDIQKRLGRKLTDNGLTEQMVGEAITSVLSGNPTPQGGLFQQ